MKRLNTGFLVAAVAASFFGLSSAVAQAPAAGGTAGATGGTQVKSTGAAGAATAPGAVAPSAAAAGSPSVGTAAPTAPATGATTPPGTTGASTTSAAPASGTAATASASTTTSGAASANAPIDGSTYVVRLRDLELRIDELKEQIRRSHTRLSLLSDTILSGGVGGARAEIVFKNDLSNAFKLTGVVFVLDGVVQYNRQDDSEAGLLESRKEIPIFSGSIPPGDHTLQVVLRLRGHGYGVFSYLRGYKFDQKSSHSFTITEGKTVNLQVVAWEKGDVTTPLEQRPAIRYESNVRSGTIDAKAAPAAGPTKPASGNGTQGAVNASGGVSIGAGAK